MQTEDGDATSIRAFDDDQLIVNMSTWESMDALAGYVYRGAHTEVMRRRREWVHHLQEMYLALWWVPAGHRPSVTEAAARLEHLRAHGPTPHAFTFQSPFSPPGTDTTIKAREDDACPA